MSGRRTRKPVVVIGGGLVGLTTALLLRHHGVDVLLVERRTTTSPQPKARRFHVRTMEILRELGLADAVRDAARDLSGHDHMAAGRTLACSERLPLFGSGADGPPSEVSPEPPCLIAQDLLEPVLRTAACDTGAEIRFGVAAVSVEPDTGTVTLADGTVVEAGYVVAADGARGAVRDALGIDRHGVGAVGAPSVSVYFRADLGDVVRGREFNLCTIEHPDVPGALASVDGRRRWVFMGRDAGGVTDWASLLPVALGVPVPDLEILSVLPWRAESLVADRFSRGRVHLVGDAAHVMPPFAALGANTGIADAHGLAWKLATVLRGDASPALLDSHDAERRPAAEFVVDQSTRRTQSMRDRASAPDPTLADPFVLATGSCRYPAGALAFGGGPPGDDPVTEFAPAARVGARVPHRWLDDAHARSTVDLAGPGWALLDGVDFLDPGEYALLRPDHVVAWRGADPAEATRARDTILSAGSQVLFAAPSQGTAHG